MDKQKLLNEFEQRYNKLKTDYNLKTSLEELNSFFMVKDHVLGTGFVPERIESLIVGKISDDLKAWLGYFNALLVSNPANLMLLNETRLLDEEDKKELRKIIKETTPLLRKHSLNVIEGNIKEDIKLIDVYVNFWKNIIIPLMRRLFDKFDRDWDKKIKIQSHNYVG